MNVNARLLLVGKEQKFGATKVPKRWLVNFMSDL